MTPFAEYLLRLCGERNMTMREVSLRAGMPEGAISTILRRFPAVRPRVQTLQSIANVLHADIFELMRRAGYDVPDVPEAKLPRLGEFIERVSRLDREQQRRIMDAFLMLLEVQESLNEPQKGVLPEATPDGDGYSRDATGPAR